MHVKLFCHFLNCRLHAVSVGKLFEWMSNFWTVWFSETESELIFGFLHTPSGGIMTLNLPGDSAVQWGMG